MMIFPSPIEKRFIFILTFASGDPLFKALRPPLGSRPPRWETLYYTYLTLRMTVLPACIPEEHVRYRVHRFRVFYWVQKGIPEIDA